MYFLGLVVALQLAAAAVGSSLSEGHKGMADLPPLLEFADGSPVKTQSDWLRRKDEIRTLLTHYYYG